MEYSNLVRQAAPYALISAQAMQRATPNGFQLKRMQRNDLRLFTDFFS
ncbi:MAG: hypothetical protein P8166_06060 [Candidatus Thiodiazotropha sp.]